MPLAPICILYCKQCITMNEYRICWFSQFGFPGEKSMCNVCIFHCIFYVLLLKSICSKYYTRLKSTFGFRALLTSGECLCGQGFGSGLC
jgi:hypothetical protein